MILQWSEPVKKIYTYFGTYHEDQSGYGFFRLIGHPDRTISYQAKSISDLPERYDLYSSEVPKIYLLVIETICIPPWNSNLPDSKFEIISCKECNKLL